MKSRPKDVAAAQARLSKYPRAALGHFPTPLEPLPRLSRAWATEGSLWVKRDDCTGLGMGGNKVRKLEFLLGEAQAQGATRVLTTGALQSNHARQTAAAAARLGLACELVLPRLVEKTGPAYEQGGNRLLDQWFGAEIFETADVADAAQTIGARLAIAKDRGEILYAIPPGGSSLTGCLGFASAAVELCEQAADANLTIAGIVVAVSTGGTLAGLLAGLAVLDWCVPVTGVCVYQDAKTTDAEVRQQLSGLAEALDFEPSRLPPFSLRDNFLGDGYGLPSPEGLAAIEACASQEGLLLDPVYTGKAMAAVREMLATTHAGREGGLVFWHTGGAPALFAYPETVPE